MPALTDSTMLPPASALESLPVELLLQIMSEVVLSSPGPSDRKLQKFPSITGTTRRVETGIHAVSLASRRLHNHANAVLYCTIVLDKEKDILLFGRTVKGARNATKSGRTRQVVITLAFLQDTVKRLAITFAPITHTDLACVFASRKPSRKVSDVTTIIAACSGAHTIAIPSEWAPILRNIGEPAEGSDAMAEPKLTELLLSSYVDLAETCCTIPLIAQWQPTAPTPVHSLPGTPSGTRPSTPDPDTRRDSASAPNRPSRTNVFEYITHLRIAEPAYAYAWYSPSALLKVFPSLTHVALARRAHANVRNDELFMEGVNAILREPTIQVMIIAIFPEIQVAGETGDGSGSIKDSTIWLAAEELRNGDGRVFVVSGGLGSWRKDWQGQGVVASPEGPGNWWRKVVSVALAVRGAPVN